MAEPRALFCNCPCSLCTFYRYPQEAGLSSNICSGFILCQSWASWVLYIYILTFVHIANLKKNKKNVIHYVNKLIKTYETQTQELSPLWRIIYSTILMTV